MAIVTNIENDHLASDDELPALVRAFDEFFDKLPADGVAIVGVDNPLVGIAGRANARRAQDGDVRHWPAPPTCARRICRFDGLGRDASMRSRATTVLGRSN